MRKRELLRRGLALALALAMLMEGAPSLALTAYAGDGSEDQVEASAQTPAPESSDTPETPDAPDGNTESSDVPTQAAPKASDPASQSPDEDEADQNDDGEASTPEDGVAPASQTEDFVLLINGKPARNLAVSYGEPLHFSLQGYSGADAVEYAYATEEDANNEYWQIITDGDCTLEPGYYRLQYGVNIDGGQWLSDDSFSIVVGKGTVGAPTDLTWTGSQMSWSAPTRTAQGGALDSGAVAGYSVVVTGAGKQFGPFETRSDTFYNHFANNIRTDGGAGVYTFTVQAILPQDNPHYSGCAVSASSWQYTVPQVTVAGGRGISAVTPQTSFLLLPGEADFSSQAVSASVAEGFAFAGWTGEGVTFADPSAPSTTLTVNADYSGAAELTVYASANDVVAPTVTGFAVGEDGGLTASAQDGQSGIHSYAFSTAEQAESVPAEQWQEAADGQQSFAFAPGAGGVYYFYAKDADGNTDRSDSGISVTAVTLVNYYPIGDEKDRTVFPAGQNTALPSPVCAGYLFRGWYENPDFTGAPVTRTEHDTVNGKMYYAKWEQETLSLPKLEETLQFVYDGSGRTLSVSLSYTGNLSYQWYKDGSPIAGATYSHYRVKDVADSGAYCVQVTLKNLLGTVLGEGTTNATAVTIGKRPVVIRPDDRTITFGDSLPELPVSYLPVTQDGQALPNTGLADGEDGSAVIQAGTVSCGGTAPHPVGTYPLTASGFSAENYEITYAEGTLTVNARPSSDVQAEIVYPGEDHFFVYNGTEIHPEVRVTDGASNLAEGTDYTLTYENATNASLEEPQVIVTLCGNYSGELKLPFEIHKASFEAQTQIDASWLYGDGQTHAPAVTGNTSQGEVSYRYAAVTLDDEGSEVLGSPTTVQPVNAGTYEVTAQIAATDNYEAVTAESCRFTIRRRTITISTSSAQFSFDGLPHSDHRYTVEGEFAPGEGFHYIVVTGVQTDVTHGVDNTAEYTLNSITNPVNYDIRIVPGKLVVTSIQLPIPANAGWNTAKPGTAQWVAVSRDQLTARYVLQLYARTGEADIALGAPVTVSGTEYDFSETIRADAASRRGSSYFFTIQTTAAGESAGNYASSDVSGLLGQVFTVCVSALGDEHVSEASITLDGTTSPKTTLVLLNGETAQLTAVAKEGYQILGWEAGEGLVLNGTSVKASLIASIPDCQVRAVTEDKAPEILSFQAVNTADYKVDLQFTAKDTVGLAGWLIQKTAEAPAEGAVWNDIAATEYTGTFTPEESGEYYLFVKDTAGSVVCYGRTKAQTDANGQVIYTSVPEARSVNRILLTPGENGTGEDKVIFKAANTSITLPSAEAYGFVSDGFAFRNWSAPSGIYADGSAYSANADETLTALWTDQHFDYTVNYYYMEADGIYPTAPALTESHSVLYGTRVSTETSILQHPRTGFVRDESYDEIIVNEANLSLNLYYRREAYSLTYRYTIPGQQETVKTVTRLYGQDLSRDFREEDKPTSPGYTFVGWHFGDTGSMPTVMPAADVEATGEFIPAQAVVSVRYFLQDLGTETYSLQADQNRELVGLHGDELTLESIQPGQVEGFTFAGALASYGSAYDGTTLPEDAAQTLAGAVVSGEPDKALYINLFYTRNSYDITLNVWKGSVGTGNPCYTKTWTFPYGADLTTGEVTAQTMESYEQNQWLSDDGYILAAAVDWSTDDRPDTMPAGDVTIARQFIRKTHGAFRVEVWLEGETENTYTPRTFEYIGYVGTKVSVGGSETDTVKLSGFANSIPDFPYYRYREVADSDVTNGTIQGAGLTGGTALQGIVTDTDGIFTEGGQKQAALVLRVFYERQAMTSTITYHVQDAKGNTTKVATATKNRKWGHSYDYEALALFHGAEDWKETPDSFAVITGDPVSTDYCKAGYVVSCNGYYQLNGVGHWPTKVYNTVASLNDSFSKQMGVANNYVDVYYTQVDTEQQYYLDVVYNARDLSYGENVDVPVTYTLDGKTYQVRVANEAYFYTDAVYHPETGFDDYPGLATYAISGQETNGYFTHSSQLREGYEIVGGKYYTDGTYIYIPVPGNPFYYGHRASYSYPEGEIGNQSISDFLTNYRAAHADDPYAVGAAVYNRGWGSSISYGNSKLTVTFRNGSVYNIYYDVSGTICKEHTYPAGSKIEEVGCSHDVFPAVAGYEIVWYREDGTKPTLPFTLNGDLRLVGKYEKVSLTSTEYAYYELADHVMLGGEEVAYITRRNMAEFELTPRTEDGRTVYTYRGNIVMVAQEVSSQSFTNLAMDTALFGALVPGVSYDASNPGNHLRGCVETEGIQLEAYFQRQPHTLTIDKNIPDTNREQITLRTGQHYTLDTPTRAGYTLGGWKLDDSADSTPLDETGTVTVTCPDSDILAIAVWTPAPFTQTFVHYYQNPSLGYDTALVSAMRTEEAPKTVRISGPGGEISGSIYSGGGVSFTLDEKTYYYRSAQLSEDGVYLLRPENLSAVVFSGEVMQEEQADVAQGCVRADWYDFAYAMFLSPEGNIEKLEGADAAYENAVGMTVEYFYTLQRGLSLSLSAQLVSGGKVPEGVILSGGGDDYYYSEVVTASAALPVGYDFIGWYEGSSLKGAPAFTDETFRLVITGDHSYTAAIQAKPVAEPVITTTPPPSLQYGYAASKENAVTVQAQFPEGTDSANYVKSYQWYLVADGKSVPIESDGQSAAYQIPQGWDVGEYALQCQVTIARKDNKLEAVYTTSPVTVSVTAAAMTVGCVNYQGIYDAREHTVVLNLPDMEDGSYRIYYSEAPLTESDLTPEQLSPVAKKDAGTYTVHYYIKSLTDNYADTTGFGTITITPKTLTIAAGSGVYHRAYDGTTLISGKVTEEGSDKYNLFQTTDIYTVQGLMSQDTYAGYVIDADAEYDDSHVLNASRLDLSNLVLVDGTSGTKNPNYTFPESYTITLSAYIDRLGLELEWENTELHYTAESQKPTAKLLTVIPAADADNLRIVTSGEQTTAGTYSASATLELAKPGSGTQINDFFLRNGSVEYSIDKLSVTIAPVANTTPVVYDGQAHTLTEFVPTKADALLKEHRLAYAEAANRAVSAGAHTITAANALILDKNGISVTDNYDITYGTAILTIGKRPVTVSGVQAGDKTYDGTTDASVGLEGIQFENIVLGDSLSLKPDSIHASFENADVGENKSVTVTLEADALAGDSAGNYNLITTELTATASITPASIVVQAKNGQTIYGEDAQFSVSLSGFAGAEDKSVVQGLGDIGYTISQGAETPVPYSRTTPAGEYRIHANVDSLKAANYIFTAEPGVLSVSQRPVTVAAAAGANITKPYDGTTAAQADNSMVAFSGVEGNTASGVVNGDSIVLQSRSQRFNSPAVADADTVTLTELSIDNENYRLVTESFTIPGKIAPVVLTVTADARQIVYGDPVPSYTATVTGFVNGETEAVLSATKTFTCDYDPMDKENNGVKENGYSISVGISSENKNYTFQKIDGTLTVKPATITITAKPASDSAIYGTNPIPEISYEYSGMKNEDDFAAVVAGEENITYNLGGLVEQEVTNGNGEKETVITSLPGTYTIIPIVSGLKADNYLFAAKSAQLAVNKYALKISGIVIDPRVYDGTAKVYDAQINLEHIVTDGLLSIDAHLFENPQNNKSLIRVTAAYTEDDGKNVGTGKNVSIAIQFLSDLEQRCYINTGSQAFATADITKRPLLIKAADCATVYGQSAPTFEVRYEKTKTAGGSVVADSGLVSGETADRSHVTLQCDYSVNEPAGDYDITVGDFIGSPTAALSNYAPEYAKGTLTVKPNRLAAPVAAWSKNTPGLVAWQAVPGIGEVAVDSYTAVLYRDGAPVDGGTVSVTASDPLQADFAPLIHSIDPGEYTVQVTANASEENNADFGNVQSSQPGHSGSLFAAKVCFQFAEDEDSQAGKADPENITIDGKDSYTMIAGEKDIPIVATLKNATGYTIKSVTAGEGSPLTVTGGTDKNRNGDTYTDTVAMSKSLNSAKDIVITLELARRTVSLDVVVTPRPGKDQASTVYGYGEAQRPVLTVKATAEDNTTAYTYSYQWQLRCQNRIIAEETHSGTTGEDSWVFPTGMAANLSSVYYTVRCIVTATRVDNGNSFTNNEKVWTNTVDYVTNVTVNRATFTAEVSMEGWTYGQPRNSPSLVNNTAPDNEIIQNKEYTFRYKGEGAQDLPANWSTALPTDAGRYQVRAEIPAAKNYEAFVTPSVDFTIGQTQLAVPTGLAMASSSTAPYGLISWGQVQGVSENAGKNPASQVAVTYQVRLYKDGELYHTYQPTAEQTLDITDDIQVNGSYYFTVQAMSSNTANCLDSAESDPFTIFMTGSITATDTTPGSSFPGNTKMYDRNPVTLSAAQEGTKTWYRYNGTTLEKVAAGTAVNVADSGEYTCVIVNNGNVYTPKAPVTITRRNVTLTSPNVRKVYDGTALAGGEIQIGGNGFASGEGATFTDRVTQTNVGTRANTFDYALNDGTLSDNYSITKTEGTLEVKPRAIAQTAQFAFGQVENVTYTGAAILPTPGVTDKGLDSTVGEKQLVEGVDFTYSYGSNLNVGAASVTITGIGNYTGTVTIPFNILQRSVSFVGNSGKVPYDGTEHTLGIADVVVKGLVAGHTTNLAYGVTAIEASPTPYPAAITAAADLKIFDGSGNEVQDNYAITTKAGSLTILPSTEPWSITLDNWEGTYDGTARYSDKTPSSSVKYGTTAYQYSFSETEGFTDRLADLKQTDAGTYTIHVRATNPNHSKAATTTAQLIIKPRPYWVTTGSDEKVYDGTALTVAEGTVHNMVAGETCSFGTTGTVTNVSEREVSNTYSLAWDGTAKESNYVHAHDKDSLGKLKITPKPVTVTAQNESKTYGDQDPALTAEVSETVNGFRIAYTLNRTPGDDAASYDIEVTADASQDNGNYAVSVTGGTFTINPRPYWVTTGSDEKVYDGTALTVAQGAVHNMANGETCSFHTTGAVTNVAQGEVNNTYSLAWDGTAKESNYVHAHDKDSLGKLKITPKPVTVTAQNKSKTYGDQDPALTAEVSETVNGFRIAYTLNREQGGDANTYPIHVDAAQSQDNGNYAVSVVDGTFTISKAAMTIRVTGEQVTATYDGKTHRASKVTYALAGGNPDLYREDQISCVNEKAAVSTDAVTQKSIGYTASDFSYANQNIEVTFDVTDGWLTVTRAVFAVSGSNYSGTYDGRPHGEAAVPTIPIGTTLLYSTDNGQSWSKEIPQITDVGKLNVKAKAVNPNYQDAICTYTLEVTPKAITVTAQDKSKIYGDADPAWTAEVSGTLNGDTIQWSGTREAGENVGSYRITPAGDTLQGNYSVAFNPGTLRIDQRALELQWSIVNAPDGTPEERGSSVVYDGLSKTAVAEFTNLAVWDGTPDVVVIDGYTGDTGVRNAGTYATEITGISGGASGNYRLADTRFQWRITPKPIGDASRPNGYAQGIAVKDLASVLYDGTEHKPEVVVTDALISGGTELQKDTDCTVTYQDNRNAGTAKVLITGIGNYEGTIEKTFPILPKPVTLQWSRNRFAYDAQTKQITASITNVVSGDAVQVSIYTGNTAKNAGSYTAQATALSGASAGNYTLSGATNPSHRWEITRAPITAQADNKQSTAGEALLELTYSLEGKLYGNDDLGDLTLATTAKDKEGSYPIKIMAEHPNPNYEITLIDGVYTLTAPVVLPTEETAETTTAVPAPDELQTAGICLWHWLILLADLIFAAGLLLTMKVCKAESEEDREKRRKRSRNSRIAGIGVLALVCIVVSILGFCWIELPLSILSVVLMSIASALLYRRKFADKTPSSVTNNP